MNTHDDGYDLFRRAVQERDADAWATIASRYRRLLIAWAARCPAAHAAEEQCEDLADRALARAWAALSPERFATFPSLSALLAYLRICVTATAIDAARIRMAHERAVEHAERADPVSIEQAVLERFDCAELWCIVDGLVKTEAERVVLVERFVQGLPPRDILARHPALFADVTAIYGAIRNLCERLRRNPDLRRWYDERRATEAIGPGPLGAVQYGSRSDVRGVPP
jgi:DNA-directed RNA polymerase specialized sigma24 family protein